MSRRWARVLAAVVGSVTVVLAVPAVAAPGPANAPEYWFDQWGIPGLWQAGARGGGVTIGEIDTGVNAALPELAANVLPGTDLGQSGDGRTDRDNEEFGHGTAMASIMVARAGLMNITGIAPDAKILPIAVPLLGTTDASQHNDHLADAIRYAADHGAKIISMSLGGARAPHEAPCPADEQAAILYALNKGDLLLASSGNTGLSGSAVEEPGVCVGVVSVGAVNSAGVVPGFSARHPYLTLSAPGVNVPSLSRVLGSAFAGDGTSQATAVAAAVMAIVWSKYPALTASQVLARVLATLDHRSTTRDPAYGYGIVNAKRAVTAAVPADAPDPVYSFAQPFIARATALAAAPPPPPAPAAESLAAPGHVSIGGAPRLLSPRVLTSLAVAAAGLMLLIVVLVSAGVRRRRRRAGPGEPAADDPVFAAIEAGANGGSGDPARMPPVPTGDLVWHDITEPGSGPGSMR